MNFLIDANLPRRLVTIFRERGLHTMHTLDLPEGNMTKDAAILQYSDENDCVVATKDSDFTSSFWLNNRPRKLLLISTGNISNKELEALLIGNFDQITDDLFKNRFVELNRDHIVVHA
jgi:predicted nuclease of predicted toxin-antitoxin system